MRTLLFLLLIGCAHDKNAQQPQPQPTSPSMDQVQLRACDSCRHELELCNKRPATTQSSGTCMDDFMKCLDAQQLDTTRCAGMN
jgi:hypothetical protein